MVDRWICGRCGKVRFNKPRKNETCECLGRFKRYSVCVVCGKSFENPKGKIYCSKECRESQSRTVEIVCDNCGRTFKRFIGNIKGGKHNFCSKECMNEFIKAEKVTSKCAFCGKEFTLRKSILKTNAVGKYCSRECYWASMRMPRKGYSGFRPAKKKYFSGANHCALCGSTDGINIHHIVPNRLTQDNSPENLIPLCRRHHMPVESLTRKVIEADGDLERVKFMLGNILRTYQQATFSALIGKEKR